MDGFSTSDKVLVIAATNRLEMVDKSLIRAGRFDVKIHIPSPSMSLKVQIFRKYLSKTKSKVSEKCIEKILSNGSYSSGA